MFRSQTVRTAESKRRPGGRRLADSTARRAVARMPRPRGASRVRVRGQLSHLRCTPCAARASGHRASQTRLHCSLQGQSSAGSWEFTATYLPRGWFLQIQIYQKYLYFISRQLG